MESAAEEPHVVRRFGELTARLYALEALLARGPDWSTRRWPNRN